MNNLTYKQLLDDATGLLAEFSDSPRIDAEVLLQAVVARPLAWLIAYADTWASAEHIKHFYALVAQRHAGQPIAYILGFKEFWSLQLEVNSAVLVPRADTETLVMAALERIPTDLPYRIADLGTGSGAIALALAKERPNAQILAADISPTALAVAQRNAQAHQLNNVDFVLSNWFSALVDERFDMIVSNPPYVCANDPHLSQGDLVAEPDIALIGQDDGLGDIRTIVASAHTHLQGDQHLFIEHGADQANAVVQLFETYGFNHIASHQDLNQLPRCTSGALS